MDNSSADRPRNRPLKVFLIEDSVAIRESLSQALESSGRVVVCGTADGANKALREIEDSDPDVVIVDLQLRQGNGFDVLAALQQRDSAHTLVKMVLTNYSTPIFKQRSMALGAQLFFDKSLEFESIIDTLNAFADRKDPQASNEASLR